MRNTFERVVRWRTDWVRLKPDTTTARAAFAVLVLSTVFLSQTVALAQNWPQFRGPDGQGHAEARGVPLQWSETQNVRWKVPVEGLGWSSPVLSNGLVWLTTSVEMRASGNTRAGLSLRAQAFDSETGARVRDVEVFRLTRQRPLNPKNSFASATPIIDGDRVYVHFGADGTAALSASGEVLWRARYDYQSQHGGGGSPVLYRDLLIFNCDGNDVDAFVVALDVKTGKERWRRDRRKPSDQAYTTPLVINVGGRDQLVSVGAYRAGAYDPLTGQEIWRVDYEPGFSNVPRPVFGHGLVFIVTGFQQPELIAVRPDGTGDVTRSHVAWTLRRGAPFTPSPILVGDELYVASDTGILTVVDARTGKVHYQQRLGGNYSASPVFADGRIYFSSEEGVTTVIAPGTAFNRLATNRLDDAILASMAMADGTIYVRGQTHLYRLGGSSAAQ
jgi:outer membrane protein assembly factor BamB